MLKIFKNLFSDSSSHQSNHLHCEVTGEQTNLDNTFPIIKIDGIIVLNNFHNPEIDPHSRVIYSTGSPPVPFYKEIDLPEEVKKSSGRLFAKVHDKDEIEMSTSIISEKGINKFTTKNINLFKRFFHSKIVMFPYSFCVPIISKNENLQEKTCINCKKKYLGVYRKYMSKRILKMKKREEEYGIMQPFPFDYDITISDVAPLHKEGYRYLFKTEKKFISVSICSNECSVQYCKQNNTLIYYNDFINKGKLRILSEYTPDINENLKNLYTYRSSNA